MVDDDFKQRVREELLRTDRTGGFLTSTDREYLLNETDIEPKTQKERDTRRRIRNRISDAILDFYIVDLFLDRRDLDEIFTLRQTGEDIDPILREGIHAIVSFLYYAAVEDEQTFENWIEAGLRHTAHREAGIRGDFKEPTVKLDITPPEIANIENISEKIEQSRLSELNSAEIEYLLEFVGPLIDSEEISKCDEDQLREALEEFYTKSQDG